MTVNKASKLVTVTEGTILPSQIVPNNKLKRCDVYVVTYKSLLCPRNVNAVWTEDHALAWHLEGKFREDSAVWALDKCLAWDQLEKQLPHFLNEIIDCPCTLAQARADTGRFHVRMQNNT